MLHFQDEVLKQSVNFSCLCIASGVQSKYWLHLSDAGVNELVNFGIGLFHRIV